MTLGQGTEGSLLVDVVFWTIAVSLIVAAIAVVQSKNLFRSALFLIVSFIGVAGLFILLRAEFLAAVQVLIYVGAVSVLILFVILMNRDVETGSPSNSRVVVPVGIIAALFGAVAIFVALHTEWNMLEPALSPGGAAAGMAGEVGGVFSNAIPVVARLLIRDFVLPFEAASVLLLTAIIGALALVRER